MPAVLPASLTPGDSCLTDTNVLIRWSERADPQHQRVRAAVRRLVQAGVSLHFTPQNAIEGWNVLTRPRARGGFDYTPPQADWALRLHRRVLGFLPDDPRVFDEWRRLVLQFGVSGVQVHDARLVAVMRVYGIAHILTFNTTDFTRYAPLGVTAIDPASL